ncbi:MAG: amino acid adenylation domain-containing protein, partial [bacterium]|nr:amino acid adenylation domain-containing protein [bacterium]
ENRDKTIADVEIISEEEKGRVLFEFNDTHTGYPNTGTIQQLFGEQAGKRPHSIAAVYEDSQITYERLNEESNRWARVLRKKGAEPGGIIGMIVDRSIEMIVGILGILKCGAAYLPLDPEFPAERKTFMLEDSRSQMILTVNKYIDDRLNKTQTIINIESDEHRHEECTDPGPYGSFDDLTYVIYTSGTTGKPKGTLTMHYNVIRVVRETNYINIVEDDRMLQLSNAAFDGSVFDIYGALLNGAALVMIQKEDVPDPQKVSGLIKREAITLFFITTALFNTLVDVGIDCFDRVRKVLFGGEKVSFEHSKKAFDYLGPDRIIHVYGPTETTVYASYYIINRVDEVPGTIPIGKPLSNTALYVLDKHLKPQPIGITGELYIGGDGLSRGYLNRPELSAQQFVFSPTVTGDRLYKTGDLVRWLPHGNIEFRGRIDHQVKIRGFRIELEGIASHLLTHPQVKEAVVLARETRKSESGKGPEERYLCAYFTAEKELPLNDLKKYLSLELPAHMVPSYFIQLEKMPLTSTGKLDRKSLPEPGLSVSQEYAAPRNQIERTLVEVWSQVLSLDKESIGIDADFFQLGGHSLLATVMITKLHQALDVKLPLGELFQTPTIRELTRYVEKAQEDKFASIRVMEDKEYYPLSPAQKRLYILNQVDVGSTSYNVPSAFLLEGPLDKEKLGEIFKQLIQRHDSLRTSFRMLDDVLVQFIHPDSNFEVEYFESPEISGTSPLSDFIRPFDLSRAPLLRGRLILNGEREHLMMVDMHHIITDGTSMDLFIKEMMALYAGMELPPLKFRYRDYSQWQSSEIQREAAKQQEQFWLTQFEGEIPVLRLPIDYPRPSNLGFEGAELKFQLSPRQSGALHNLVSDTGATLYMVLLTIYTILLFKISGQEDIVVGSPVAGRSHVDLESIIGMFVNTLAVRNYPAGDKTAKDFLKEVKERTVAAFDNQEYPFEDLVDQLVKDRDTSRNPLFDVMFSLSNMEARTRDIPIVEMTELKITPYQIGHQTTKFDLSLNCVEAGENIRCVFEYSTRLFKQETIQRFTGYFNKIIQSVSRSHDVKISGIEIISQEEKQQLLLDFNDTTANYPKDKTIHQLFEEQADKTPGHIALVGQITNHKSQNTNKNDTSITYCELNRMADGLARQLTQKGVAPDSIVAIMAERSLEMIIGIYGILKAGAAYLPIDPEYPEERVRFMLQDSGAKIIVTNGLKVNGLDGLIVIKPGAAGEFLNRRTNEPIIQQTNLAYIIYTSGSTGKPKGTMVEHGGVVNLLSAMQTQFPLEEGDVYLLKTPYIFDV